jgi:hypothetical protein
MFFLLPSSGAGIGPVHGVRLRLWVYG